MVERLEARQLLATWTVTASADTGPGSLREAIARANSQSGADTIVFDLAGDAVINVTQGEMEVTDDVVIAGPPDATITLDAQQLHRFLHVTTPGISLEVSDLTLRNGEEFESGGAILITRGSSLTLRRVSFFDNLSAGESGGAVAANDGALLIEDSWFEGNRAGQVGGAVASIGLTDIRGTTFVGNSA